MHRRRCISRRIIGKLGIQNEKNFFDASTADRSLIRGARFGRVGITFCPGKYDPHAMSGYWDRDLSLDLDAIRDWGAAAVVTLLSRRN